MGAEAMHLSPCTTSRLTSQPRWLPMAAPPSSEGVLELPCFAVFDSLACAFSRLVIAHVAALEGISSQYASEPSSIAALLLYCLSLIILSR